MTDKNNAAKSSNTDRTESGMDFDWKISPTGSKQSFSSSEYSKSGAESKSDNVQNDSEHTIGPSLSIRYSKFDIKSERQPANSSLIHRKIKEHCFSYKNENKQVEELHNSEEVSKEEVDENSEDYVDQYLRRLQGETQKKSFNESKSKDDKEFEQAQLKQDLNNLNISISQNFWDTDYKSEYFLHLNYILDSKGWDKLTEKLNRMTLEHQVREIKGMGHENLKENKSKVTFKK